MGKKGRSEAKSGKKAHKRWQQELRDSLSTPQTSRINVNVFRDYNPLNTNNCYVKLSLDSPFEIGFKYNDKVFILSGHKKPSIISIMCSNKYSLTLTSFVNVDKCKIVRCGNIDTKVIQEIEFRLSLFNRYLKSEDSYLEYFMFLYKNRENKLIEPYFKQLFSAERSNYEECFSNTVKNTLKYFIVPSFLSKGNKSTSISSQPKSVAQSKMFQFTEYRNTNGIYYTLSDERTVLSDENVNDFNFKYLKRFAYVAGEILAKYFSFMTAKIDPANRVINFKYHNGKWNELTIPINIDQYIVTIETRPSGLSKILWNISAQIAQKLYINETHNSISYKSTINNNTPKQSYKNGTTFLKASASTSVKGNNNTIVLAHKELEKTLKERKMHYRKGHWHYYWYGSKNSPERHKELKWVDETIVNRDCVNIVIVM